VLNAYYDDRVESRRIETKVATSELARDELALTPTRNNGLDC